MNSTESSDSPLERSRPESGPNTEHEPGRYAAGALGVNEPGRPPDRTDYHLHSKEAISMNNPEAIPMSQPADRSRRNRHQPGRARQLRRLARRAAVASTATATVLAGLGVMSLAGSPAAHAATSSPTPQPSCNDAGNSGVQCSETFTSSGSVSTANWDWGGTSPIQVNAVGGHGGAAGDGTPGGEAGMATVSYTPFFTPATFKFYVGANGGAGGAGNLFSPGGGGAGGGAGGGQGPGGAGASGNGNVLYGIALGLGYPDDGGGGGGGATTVYENAPGYPLVATGAGGGGAAEGIPGSSGVSASPAKPGGAVGQSGAGNCAGAGGSATAAGQADTNTSTPCSGGAGSGNSSGGNGGVASQETSPAGVLISDASGGGGGGGGGGLHGGAGGNLDISGEIGVPSAGGGGGAPNNSPSSAPAGVTFTWGIPATTTTTLSMNGDGTSAAPISAAVSVSPPPGSLMPVDGEVNVLVDGIPVASPVAVTAGIVGSMNGIDAALSALPAGSHSVQAQFSPFSPSGGSYGWSPSASTTATINVGGLSPLSITGADAHFTNGVAVVKQSTNPTLTVSLPPADNNGRVVFADNGGTVGVVPVSNGQASTVYYPWVHFPGTVEELTATYVSWDDSIIDPSPPVPLYIESAEWSFAKVGAPTTQLLEDHGDAPSSATPDGTAVDTWSEVTNGDAVQANELWTFNVTTSGGYAQLYNEQSHKCLEVNGSNGSVDQWDCVAGATNELWRWVSNPSGGDSLQVESSGQYLATTTPSASVGDGTSLTMQASQGDTTGWTPQM